MLLLCLAAAGGAWSWPLAGDYSGFMDYAEDGSADASIYPLCGTPQVGFAPGGPGSGEENSRLGPAGGVHFSDTNWSWRDAGILVTQPVWVVGTEEDTDGDIEFGFVTISAPSAETPTQGELAPHQEYHPWVEEGFVDVRLRNIAARNVKQAGVDAGPAPYDPSEQSDGWFRFRVRMNEDNFPPSVAGQPAVAFRINFDDNGHGRNRFFDEGGYDWAVFRPLYREVYCDNGTMGNCGFGPWARAVFLYSEGYDPPELRTAKALFAAPVSSACNDEAGCQIEVAQMLPYTNVERDDFVNEVRALCDSSVYCEVWRPGHWPWQYNPLATGLSFHSLPSPGFRMVEFAPFDMTDAQAVRPPNVIFITAGVHYEPNSMFVVESIVRELMAAVSSSDPAVRRLVFGDPANDELPVSYAVVLGASPHNLAWGTTHVNPLGDYKEDAFRPGTCPFWVAGGGWVTGTTGAPWERPDEFRWNSAFWPFDYRVNPIEPLGPAAPFDEYILLPRLAPPPSWTGDCTRRRNNEPETIGLRRYFTSLATASSQRFRLGQQVALHLDLHGDIAPPPTSWDNDGSRIVRYPPPYGIWALDGDLVTSQTPFAVWEDRVEAFAENLRDPAKSYASPFSAYFRKFAHWWGPRDVLPWWTSYEVLHDYRRNNLFSPAPFDGYAPYNVVIELPETGLYRYETDDPYPFPNGTAAYPQNTISDCATWVENIGALPFVGFCVDGTIDHPFIYEYWGRSIIWAARDAFHDFGLLTRELHYYCDDDQDDDYASTVSGSCNTNGTGCPVGDCITWPGDDCDDGDPAVGPGGLEVCDGRDNDCNGVTDDGGDALCPAFTDPCNPRQVCGGTAGCVLASDTDGDELADVDEPNWFASPIVGDTDGDGLLDKAEACVAQGGLCPRADVADSDGDGLGDGVEAQLGTDYCNPDTDDDRLGDAEDPTPTDPGAPRAYLEDECRALGDFISSISYTLFKGSTTMEKKAKRTGLASYAYTAANKLASNLADPQAALLAEEQLLALQLYVDGAGYPDDWMLPSSEKTAVYDETDLLLYLLAYM